MLIFSVKPPFSATDFSAKYRLMSSMCLLLLSASLSGCNDDSDSSTDTPKDLDNPTIKVDQNILYTKHKLTFSADEKSDAAQELHYEWRFLEGDNTIIKQGDIVSHMFSTPGAHMVELLTTNAKGDKKTQQEFVSVLNATEYIIPPKEGIRVATFNAGLDAIRANGQQKPVTAQGLLNEALSAGDNPQAKKIAEIIQRTNPDILLLNEIDGNDNAETVNTFNSAYLQVAQNGTLPINYPYIYTPTCNTGIVSGYDLNNSGKTQDADDAYGFGNYPGQYCMAIFSKYPIDTQNIHTFQNFLWKDMPNALQPLNTDGSSWYQEKAWQNFRLSSKNHVDVPILVDNQVLHILAAHPTPPVFDSEEDRNGRRNFDEIRLWTDYINSASSYLYDDSGNKNVMLSSATRFIILGDYNASATEGDATTVNKVTAINQLLKSKHINSLLSEDTPENMIPSSQGGKQNAPNNKNARYHTANWKMRADYVLPSAYGFDINQTGVFWPNYSDSLYYLVNTTDSSDFESSDHRLVWTDVSMVIK